MALMDPLRGATPYVLVAGVPDDEN